MTTMYEKLRDVRRYPFSENALFEPTVRLPYALHSPAIITHIPLFDKSQEDLNFEEQARLLSGYYQSHGSQSIKPELEPDDITAIIEISKLEVEPSDRPAAESIIREAWKGAHDSFKHIVGSYPELDHPEYVIFRSKSLLSRDINRDAHTAIVRSIKKAWDGEQRHDADHAVWRSEFVKDNAFDLTNATIHFILRKIDDFIEEFRGAHAPSKLARESVPKQDILGGLVSWMDGLEIGRNMQSKETGRRVFKLSKERSAREIGPSGIVVDEYLVWRRGEQNWRYTFYDGLYEYPKKSAGRLTKFIKRLLNSADLKESFPASEGLEKALGHPAVSAYRLPGTRIGGAQYFMIPAELLLVLSVRFADICELAGCPVKKDPELLTADRRPASKCTDAIFEVAEGFPELKPEASKLKDSIDTARIDSSVQLAELLDSIKGWLENLVGALQRETKPHRKFYSSFAGIAEICWKLIYSDAPQLYGHDDFICSRVIDDRALYFSNFRPIEKGEPGFEGNFTRTFFIDFGLTNYQRARLARRLCEVATYRMSCIKDIGRIRAMQDGLDELNSEFSKLVAETSKDISGAMHLARPLYQQMLDFDRFISDGVLGRRLSSEAEWGRVQKQVADIREKRVGSYASLTDFLDRGLAASVSDISRFAGRYENLRNRVRDHLSRMRTEVTMDRMEEIGRLLKANKDLALTSEKLLSGVEAQATQQTGFLRNAEILVVIGAIYYTRSLLEIMIGKSGAGLHALIEEVGIIIGLIFLILIVKRYADVVFAAVARWCNAFVGLFRPEKPAASPQAEQNGPNTRGNPDENAAGKVPINQYEKSEH
jgi:uncharacterized membrane-anchored protein